MKIELITRLLKRDKERSVLSRSDFLAMARIGAKEGVFEKTESEIIHNLLRFERVRAKDIMTPRTVIQAVLIAWARRSALPGVVFREMTESRSTLLPFH